MRLYKAIAQIFLFLFILNFTFASIALFSQTQTQTQTTTDDEMHVDSGTTRSGENVTTMEEVSEKVHTQQSDEEEEEEFPEWQGGHPSIDGRLHLRFNIARRTYSSDPAQDKFLNDEMTRKLKEYIILGAIAGSMTGIANAMQKEIIGTVSPNAETVGRSVKPLDDESPRDQEDLVSRSLSHSLSNVGDKDLQIMSIISRRMLSGLD